MYYSGDDVPTWLCNYLSDKLPSKLIFLHNGLKIKSQNDSGFVSIDINPLTIEDNGLYVCEALDDNGDILDSKNVTLTVIGELLVLLYHILSLLTRH